MSGARTKKERKQQAAAARAVAAARGQRRQTAWIITAVVVVIVIGAAVIGGVLWQKQQESQAAETVVPALTVPGSAKYPVQVDKATATVVVGQPNAKVTIDFYEDFLCPICGEFEKAYFQNPNPQNSVEAQLEAGTIKVNYHMLNLLDSHSSPPGYSMMAANTALAVATVTPQKFMDFHYSLYQKQPSEGGAGWTQAQLTNLANRLGVSGPAFDALVNNKTYDAQINTNLNSAENNPALQQQSSSGQGFGTPTVVAGGKTVNWSDPNWLSTVIKSTP